MKAVYFQDGVVHVGDVAEPEPAKGQALVRTHSCGLCASDQHYLHSGRTLIEMSKRFGGSYAALDNSRPVVPGHEYVGEVIDCGPGKIPRRRLKVYFDGGCRPNPGKIEVAVVARGHAYVFDDIGHGTNNDAEWLALIHALQLAQTLDEPEFELIGDSALVINQANGFWKCRGTALQAHLDRFLALAAIAPPARIRWIGRNQNLAGIALAARHER